MKKFRLALIMTALAVMIIGGTITSYAAAPKISVDRTSITTEDGTKINFSSMTTSTQAQLQSYITDTAYDDYTNYFVLSSQSDANTDVYYCMFYHKDSFAYCDPYAAGTTYYPRVSISDDRLYRITVTHQKDTGSWLAAASNNVGWSTAPYNTLGYDMKDIDVIRELTKTQIAAANANIYTDSNKSSVFLMAPKTVLAPVAAAMDLTGAVKEIVSLVPICLVCLVGYLALRKALAVLQSLLHQA